MPRLQFLLVLCTFFLYEPVPLIEFRQFDRSPFRRREVCGENNTVRFKRGVEIGQGHRFTCADAINKRLELWFIGVIADISLNR